MGKNLYRAYLPNAPAARRGNPWAIGKKPLEPQDLLETSSRLMGDLIERHVKEAPTWMTIVTNDERLA